MFRRWSKLVKFGLALIFLSSSAIFLYHLRLWDDEKDSGVRFEITRPPLPGRPAAEQILLDRNRLIDRFNPKLIAHKTRNASKLRSVDEQYHEDDGASQARNNLLKKGNEAYDLNYDVHAFYYAWYGNPAQDGKYFHWNHEYLPHWEKRVSARFPTGQAHVPPGDIGSTFYPLLGPYSSVDENITILHMQQMQKAGIGVLSLSWYPPGMADDHGEPMESYIPTIFDIANRYNMKVCFHIEPYKGRNAKSMRDNMKYILEMYGDRPAFYRHSSITNNSKLPLVYVYDSYLIPSSEWQRLLTKSGDLSVRGTELDFLAIGLLVEKKHMGEIVRAGFDGIYTYFAADGFSYGSSKRNWNDIALTSQQNNMIFIPSVGPGYDDTRVRPWNKVNSKLRRDGAYYDESWGAAINIPTVQTISITSFNEWHEGTQIEPADSRSNRGRFTYLTYGPHEPDYYLKMTKNWSLKLLQRVNGK